MAFCNIHCLRKSSRIIVIPTTSVNVLWDAIVPLSPTPTLIGSTFCQTSKFIVFRNTSVVFLNINNKRHLSVHPKEAISLGKGVSIFMSLFNFLVLIPYFSVYLYCNIVLDIVHFVIQTGELLFIITLNKIKIIYDTRFAQGMYNN